MMKSIAIAMILIAGASHAQPATYDADALNYRAAVAYDAGDAPLAAVLWRLSAKAGSTDSMTAYAGLREIGDGVARSQTDALRWYARAARRGDPLAMALLADSLHSADPVKARILYARASALGHPYATRRLAHPPGETMVTETGGPGETK